RPGIILAEPDCKLQRQELYRAVCDLTLLVRQFRPQVMLTFGSEGGVTAHTDHSMAGIFATLAFQWAGRSNRYPDQIGEHTSPHRTQKLYYSTTDFTLPGRQPVTFTPATAVIDSGDRLESKIAAFKAHNPQTQLWPTLQ